MLRFRKPSLLLGKNPLFWWPLLACTARYLKGSGCPGWDWALTVLVVRFLTGILGLAWMDLGHFLFYPNTGWCKIQLLWLLGLFLFSVCDFWRIFCISCKFLSPACISFLLVQVKQQLTWIHSSIFFFTFSSKQSFIMSVEKLQEGVCKTEKGQTKTVSVE